MLNVLINADHFVCNLPKDFFFFSLSCHLGIQNFLKCDYAERHRIQTCWEYKTQWYRIYSHWGLICFNVLCLFIFGKLEADILFIKPVVVFKNVIKIFGTLPIKMWSLCTIFLILAGRWLSWVSAEWMTF